MAIPTARRISVTKLRYPRIDVFVIAEDLRELSVQERDRAKKYSV